MSIQVGIVGLPNVGKSTLFNALSAMEAESANFPFCTIEPNVGNVLVPDPRLDALAKIYTSQVILPTTLEFVDIAGLVKGAAQGEGLGNQFLGHIRSVDAILHVVRCFDSEDTIHVYGNVDPQRDVEIIEAELIFKDLDTLERSLQRLQKLTKGTGPAAASSKLQAECMQHLIGHLQKGLWITPDMLVDGQIAGVCKELGLLTSKPVLFVANVSEDMLSQAQNSAYVQKLEALALARGTQMLIISAEIEAEIARLPKEEQAGYLESLNLEQPGLFDVIRGAYALLNLITFFTVGPKEARAWTIEKDTRAPQAAGVIHSDFERGFIRAEIMSAADLLAAGSEAAVRARGQLRIEGKEYKIQDGDVVHFRFNV
jgi:GTP-binding protein YchF